jgi:hypothetical protein
MFYEKLVRMRNAHTDLDRKPESKRPFGRPICRWKVTVKTDFKEIVLEGFVWVWLAQDTEP